MSRLKFNFPLETNPEFYKTKEILVVGDVMLDETWFSEVGRISPEAPIAVGNIQGKDYRLGGAANVARNLVGLGSPVTLIGLLGDDERANIIEKLCEEVGIKHELIRGCYKDTITKLRIMAAGQHILRLDYEAPVTSLEKDNFMAKYLKALDKIDIVVISDYAKGAIFDAEKLIKAAKEKGKKIIVDPKGSSFKKYSGATIITPNLSEFKDAVGGFDKSKISLRANQLLKELNLSFILLTKSQDGMSLFSKEGVEIDFRTQAKTVFDVTGAGDTVVAGLAFGLSLGISVEEACHLANVSAGIVVGKVGTAALTLAELEHELKKYHDKETLHLSSSIDKLSLEQLKKEGKVVVMTNGCFDILHPGHLNYLQKARELGDLLIVAINTDSSVSRLKGPSRPINDLSHRKAMLSALPFVDHVVDFSEDTPERLYQEFLPDILVKGSDYNVKDIVGADEIIAAGGKVVTVDFLEGHSTSSIIERIKNG